MKKIAFILTLLLSAFICNAEGIVTSGNELRFKIPKNDRLQSFILSKYDNVEMDSHYYFLTLLLRDAHSFYSFPDNSKLLLKLSNDSIIELNSFGDEDTNHLSTIIMGIPVETYETYRRFKLSDLDLQNILTYPIVKIRIELSNGDRKDIEMKSGESKKLLKNLNKSLKIIQEKQEKRVENVSNDLKDDF